MPIAEVISSRESCILKRTKAAGLKAAGLKINQILMEISFGRVRVQGKEGLIGVCNKCAY